MASRLELQEELLKFLPNVYFQPPSNIRMIYPCIVYNKSSQETEYANNTTYNRRQGYQITVIEKNPDSDLGERMVVHFPYSALISYFTVDNLNQTIIKLYF